jgi:2-polyprenyl-3-methyl-5-hydroxy-6-metoxy-1,4-benzoquinol methylase
MGYLHCFIQLTKNLEPLTPDKAAIVEKFNSRISEMEMEEVACLCGADSFYQIASTDSYGVSLKTVCCLNCGLVQSNPRMTEKAYREFYESDLYRKLYDAGNAEETISNKFNEPDKYSNDSQAIFERVLPFKPINETSSILEFGAYGGYNLSAFLKNGAQVTGIDYSPEGVTVGKRFGINMIQGGFEKLEGEFDVILLTHVLEHFLDPIAGLKKIKDHLKPNGLFYISVPNIIHFGMGQLQCAHVYYFNPYNFEYFANIAGLKMIDSGVSQKIHIYGLFKSEDLIADQEKLVLSKKIWDKKMSRFVFSEVVKLILKKTGLFNILKSIKIRILPDR